MPSARIHIIAVAAGQVSLHIGEAAGVGVIEGCGAAHLEGHDTLDDHDWLPRDFEAVEVEGNGEERRSLRVDEMPAPKIAGVVGTAEHDPTVGSDGDARLAARARVARTRA